jgi:hypothetical protein
MSSTNLKSPLLQALLDGQVSAMKVVDIDQHRNGLTVETDYVIAIETTGTIAPFKISKRYTAFRSLAQELDPFVNSSSSSSAEEKDLIEYGRLVIKLIEAQRTQYLGKVNFTYVKMISQQRKVIIEDVLAATLQIFPKMNDQRSSIAQKLAQIWEIFLLNDHVQEITDEDQPQQMGSPASNTSKNAFGTGLEALNPLTWVTHTKKKKNTWVGTTATTTTTPPPPLTVEVKKAVADEPVVVVPLSQRSRLSTVRRKLEQVELSKYEATSRLMFENEEMLDPSSERSNKRTRFASMRSSPNTSPLVEAASNASLLLITGTVTVVVVLLIVILRPLSKTTVVMDGDLSLLMGFACYCLGLHTPHKRRGITAATEEPLLRPDRSGRKLLRRSMIVSSPTTRNRLSMVAGSIMRSPLKASQHNELIVESAHEEEEEEEEESIMGSPMAKFPEGSKIGSHLNCWSSPDAKDFSVRGPNYLVDRKKIPSDDYLFPCRGLDLFLTDACPQNLGRNPGVFGGKMREKPTFIINFRLPWGVLLFYSEIPSKFVPFLEAQSDAEKDKLIEALGNMTPPERTAARWLMSDAAEKNKTLKIVPVVVDGPWVVKSVVGGKPALIGEKLPVDYFYQPAEGNKALYLEADLDIAASSAARGILSIARSYTNILTINLGFVIQGNQSDELPEQMLLGARLHGIDPLTAPSFPASEHDFMVMDLSRSASDDASV